MNTSKPSAELATGLKHKFETDIFFSTRVKIIAFVTLLTITIVIVFSALIGYIEQIIYIGVTESLNQAIVTGQLDPTILSDTSGIRDSAFLFVLVTVIVLATFAGGIAARVALEPVAHALNLQKRFIESAAHELRTPLAILKTNNEVALFDAPENHPLREIFEENIEDVNQVTEILNNLMLLHRTNAFGAVAFEQVSLQPIFERIKKRLHGLSEAKNISLSIQNAVLPTVYGNATALEQVFFNLTKNAILYTPAGGSVAIEKGPSSASTASVRVTDTGVGIAKEDFPHVFEPFYRSAQVSREKGSGLGLAIVFEIVKLHGGKIMIQSGKDKGTTFTISLPRSHKQQPSDIAAEDSAEHFDFSKERRD